MVEQMFSDFKMPSLITIPKLRVISYNYLPTDLWSDV